jgi:molybdenum cofactor guanylyltransferase
VTCTEPVALRDITAVILAGGMARRMGGEDKGLIELNGRPLLDYVIAGLRSRVGAILVNANRNLERYREFGYPVIEDIVTGFSGPLAGMATGMQAAGTPLLLTVPCDSPFVPPDLGERLLRVMRDTGAGICVAHDGERLQPVHALLKCRLLPDLLAYLNGGGRKIDTWYARHRMARADFSGMPDMFLNLNTPADRQLLEDRLAAAG